MRERIGKMIPGLAELSIIEGQVKGRTKLEEQSIRPDGIDAPKAKLLEPVDPRIAAIPSRERLPYFVR